MIETKRLTMAVAVFSAFLVADTTLAQQKPNILMIMADDVGWANPSCYHQGLMSSRTPNIDKLAA